MGGVKINFADVDSSFEPLPEGRYEVEVERVEVRESKSSDNNYLNWELNVLDEEYEGRKLWMITSLSERALFRLKDVFLALDVIEEDEELELEWDDDIDITPGEGPQVTNPDLAGQTAIAIVSNEVYDGKERNKVGDLVAVDGVKAPAKKSGGSKKAGAKKSSGGRRKLR